MLKTLKLWHLAGALRAKGNSQAAYSAVLELGQLGTDKAVDLLVEALARADGVARHACRELGRMRNQRAIAPLVALLGQPEVSRAAVEALIGFGEKAVAALLEAARQGNACARAAAASALGEIRDKRATETLIALVQTDDEYEVRIAAATALGTLKDPRAVWVLVATLSLRDEITPERQERLATLRQASSLALRRIGDPLAGRPTGSGGGGAPDAMRMSAPDPAIVDEQVHPRLRTPDLKDLGDEDLKEVLKDVITASEEVSWAQLENRKPLIPSWFSTYEQRSGVAVLAGHELFRRGGSPLMRRVWEDSLGSHPAIRNWWSGIGDWA